MKIKLAALALLVALMGMLLAPMSAAAAPKGASASIPASGTSTLNGLVISLTQVLAQDGQLFAVGDIRSAAGELLAANQRMPVDLAATTAANQTAAAAGELSAQQEVCQILYLVLGPLDLNLLGLRIQLNQVVLNITADPSGGLLGQLLCGIADLLNGGPLADLTALLTQLNTLIGQLTDFFNNLAALPATATIGGTMLAQSFTRTGDQITANGVLGGQQVSAPVDLAATQQQEQTCQILHLVLGPLDLNLLGLRIQLSQVVLTITAEPGPGNLLGNLLCAIANLLNGPAPAAGLTNKLNRLLGALVG